MEKVMFDQLRKELNMVDVKIPYEKMRQCILWLFKRVEELEKKPNIETLLSSAKELGLLHLSQYTNGTWECYIASRHGCHVVMGKGLADTDIAAIQIAITKAKEVL